MKRQTKNKNRRNKKQSRTFRTAFLGVWLAFVLVIMIALVVLYIRMNNYEKGLPEHEMDRIVKEIKAGNASKLHLTSANEAAGEMLFIDDALISDFLKEKANESETDYVRVNSESTGDEIVYMIRNESGNLLKVKIQREASDPAKNRTKWTETESVIENSELKLETLTIQVPAESRVAINGTEVSDAFKAQSYIPLALLSDLAGRGIINDQPYMDEYQVRGVFADPQVTMTGYDAQSRECHKVGDIYVGGYEADDAFIQEQTQRVMDIMESYARYFSDDAPASVLNQIMLDNSPARETATNVDLSWVQAHDNVEVTEKSVKNFRKYSDECYSCDISFVETIYQGDYAAKTWDTNMTWIMVKDGDYYIADFITKTADES